MGGDVGHRRSDDLPFDFATFLSADFVFVKSLAKDLAKARILFHVLSRPDSDLQYPLKLLGRKVPAVGITETMGWKVVVDGVFATCAVSVNVVGIPLCALHTTSANVTAAIGLVKNECTICSAESLPSIT
jgi:hypothetical protein